MSSAGAPFLSCPIQHCCWRLNGRLVCVGGADNDVLILQAWLYLFINPNRFMHICRGKLNWRLQLSANVGFDWIQPRAESEPSLYWSIISSQLSLWFKWMSQAHGCTIYILNNEYTLIVIVIQWCKTCSPHYTTEVDRNLFLCASNLIAPHLELHLLLRIHYTMWFGPCLRSCRSLQSQ